MARRDAVDEAELDGDGDDLQAAPAGEDDDLALEFEAVGVQFQRAQQPRGVAAKAALRDGDRGAGRFRDAPGGEAVRVAAAREHVLEQMRAAADDEISVPEINVVEELRDLAREVLSVGVERDHGVVAAIERPREAGLQSRALAAIDLVTQ